MTDKKEENLREDIFSVIGGISPKDNEYFYGKDADRLVEIVHHYADSQAKERAVGFAKWIRENHIHWHISNSVMGKIHPAGYLYKGEYYSESELYTEYEIFTKQK